MELLSNQSAQLMKRFPQFELSYETISHKKVAAPYDVCLAIPQSKKYYAWFSFHRNTDVCYLMELTREKKIGRITTIQTIFHPSLSLGTLVYGSLIEYNGPTKQYHFLVEDMLWYKGISLKNTTFGHKLGFIHEFMSKSIVQKFADTEAKTIYNVAFVLPVMRGISDHDAIEPEFVSRVSYHIHHIQYRCLTKIVPFLNVFPNKMPNLTKNNGLVKEPTSILNQSLIDTTKHYIPDFFKPQYAYKTIFRVCADLQYDIYHLYAYGKNTTLVYYDIAYIPNYKTSVFMNGLFRNIKENRNLDYIEESDDDDDFQDMRTDKYVDLAKILFVECVFNKKFRRWTPVRLIENQATAIVIHIGKLAR